MNDTIRYRVTAIKMKVFPIVTFMTPTKNICLVSLSKVPFAMETLLTIVISQCMGGSNLSTFLIEKVSIEGKVDRIYEIFQLGIL